MRDEFVIVRQGKNFVLFAGLLDEAHNRGLKAIDTELLQVPDESNGRVAVVKATVELEDGRRFSGIGDASPDNVGRNIQPHILRMAETRAKARALRDAINVSMVALEELGGDEQESSTPTSTPRRPTEGREKANTGHKKGNPNLPATRKQLNYLETLVNEKGDMAKFEEVIGKSMSEMNQEEASEWISKLAGKAAE